MALARLAEEDIVEVDEERKAAMVSNLLSCTAATGAHNRPSIPGRGVRSVHVAVGQRSAGQPFLLVHGGAGPQSMDGFASLLADTGRARVVTPTHPGFDGTSRPDALGSVRRLA